MWISRKRFNAMQASIERLEGRVRQIERAAGVMIGPNGQLVETSFMENADLLVNQVVAQIAQHLEITGERAHGPRLNPKGSPSEKRSA